MEQIEKLIQQITETNSKVESILLGALTVSIKLNSSDLKELIEKELRGYPNTETKKIPKYRHINSVIKGDLVDPYGQMHPGVVIGMDYLNEKVGGDLNYFWDSRPLPLIDEWVSKAKNQKQDFLATSVPDEMKRIIQSSTQSKGNWLKVYREVGVSQYENVLLQARTLLLQILIEINESLPKEVETIAEGRAQMMQNVTNIYGDIVNSNLQLGERNTQGDVTINVGQLKEELYRKLGEIGVPKSEVDALSAELNTTEEKPKMQEVFASWTKTITDKILEKSIDIGFDMLPLIWAAYQNLLQ